MKNAIKFHRNMIIFHLIIYPLMTWFLVSSISDKKGQIFMIWMFATGMVVSIIWTSILPLIRLRKQEKINKSYRIMKEGVE
jgi:hypothetical protein